MGGAGGGTNDVILYFNFKIFNFKEVKFQGIQGKYESNLEARGIASLPSLSQLFQRKKILYTQYLTFC